LSAQECRVLLKQFQENFLEVADTLSAGLKAADAAVGVVTNAERLVELSFEGGEFDEEDLDTISDTMEGLATSIQNASSATQTLVGNERAFEFGQIKALSDLLILTNPRAIDGLIKNLTERLNELIQETLEQITTVIDQLNKVQQTFADKFTPADQEALNARNQALFNQARSLSEEIETDATDILENSSGLATPRASADTICDDLEALKQTLLGTQGTNLNDLVREIQKLIEELDELSFLLKDILDEFDRLLNHRENFQSRLGGGLIALRRSVLEAIKGLMSSYTDFLDANVGNDDFDLSSSSRDFYFQISILHGIFCRDSQEINTEMNNDPNGASIGNMVASLRALDITSVNEFIDEINEIIRIIRSTVVTKNTILMQTTIGAAVSSLQIISGLLNSILAITAAVAIADPLGAANSLVDLFSSSSFDRLKSLVEQGGFAGYFESLTDSATSAGALAQCVSEFANTADDAFTRAELQRAANDCQGIANSQAAQSRALNSRRSAAIGAPAEQDRTFNSIKTTIDRHITGDRLGDVPS